MVMRGHSDSFPLVLVGAIAGLGLLFRSAYEDALKAYIFKKLTEWLGPLATDVVSGVIEIVPAITLAIVIVLGLYTYMKRNFEARFSHEIGLKRLRLSKLRGAGVRIRNASLCLEHSSGCFDDLIAQMETWEQETVDAIAAIDPADAESFRWLDEVPEPKIKLAFPCSNHEGEHIKAHKEHDFRIKKLGLLIDRYASR